jgi:hypothetical protein
MTEETYKTAVELNARINALKFFKIYIKGILTPEGLKIVCNVEFFDCKASNVFNISGYPHSVSCDYPEYSAIFKSIDDEILKLENQLSAL